MLNRGELLKQVEDMDIPILVPRQVAPIIGTDPHTLRLQARLKPETLGFPVIVAGTRVKIPRIPFIKYMKGIA